ncbi:hypothetical protein DICPUDRAFT_148075 [Dictyostelium purpureum]|uniref:Transmembrane protein n=1 Tax=Dictyostelium purpureum TaxID=5786 RepID=F0ZA63_DICPU|nr:uncharacterized protein DICPUDRAFT_148075 [Dictyostelium purpureum]EGC39181.1 hypothetical protein DICPUDRAFT_148075 [Dictyostelium purpureum]|eukprot:XP_003284327.1 hypothetical protein DICPUDRAFT_148075 [Dictyostelium purpureum]
MSSFVDTCFKLSKTHDYTFFTVHTLFWLIGHYLLSDNKKPIESKNNGPKNKKLPPYKLTKIEKIFATIMISVTIINILLRISKGVPHWLIQPCHVLSVILICVLLDKNSSSNLFYLYFYTLWMPVFGLLAVPDDSWFYYSWEPFVFYLHHYTMVLIPFYYLIFNHRFHAHFKSKTSLSYEHYFNPKLSSFKNRIKLFVQIFILGMLYHTVVLGFGGLLLDEDFNSMRCRFPGGEMLGIWWREALSVGGLIVGILVAMIPDTIFHYFLHKDNNNQQQTKSTPSSNFISDLFNYVNTLVKSEIKKNE